MRFDHVTIRTRDIAVTRDFFQDGYLVDEFLRRSPNHRIAAATDVTKQSHGTTQPGHCPPISRR